MSTGGPACWPTGRGSLVSSGISLAVRGDSRVRGLSVGRDCKLMELQVVGGEKILGSLPNPNPAEFQL